SNRVRERGRTRSQRYRPILESCWTWIFSLVLTLGRRAFWTLDGQQRLARGRCNAQHAESSNERAVRAGVTAVRLGLASACAHFRLFWLGVSDRIAFACEM